MNEVTNVSDVKFSLEKQKGTYTGQALTGVISATPEGFGKAILKDGTILDGRFKEGNFVSGKAISPQGDVFEGEFDNFKWLGGTISYKNGDRLVGTLNAKTNKFDLTEFRITQEFGDVFEGKINPNDETKSSFVGTQIFADESKIIGTFSSREASKHGSDFEKKFVETKFFGVIKPVFELIEGTATLNFKTSNKTQQATLVGIAKNGEIKGELNIFNGNFAEKMNGTFNFSRMEPNETNNHKISDDFGNFFGLTQAKAPYICCISLNQGGKITFTDGVAMFDLVKKIEDKQTFYVGTFKSPKQDFNGTFFDNLAMKEGQISVQFENSQLSGNLKNSIGNNYNLLGKQTFENGEFKNGRFNINFKQPKINMPMQSMIDCEFECGTLKKIVTDKNGINLVFEGKTRNVLSEEERKKFDITAKPSLFKEENQKTAFLGTIIGAKNSEIVLLKSGLFDTDLTLLEGHIEDHAQANGQEIWVNGDLKFNKNNEARFFGRAVYPNTEDFFEGEFLPDYTFLAGQMQTTLENGAIFKGKTQDLKTFFGIVERKNDFWQKGEFHFKQDGILDFVKGTTLVCFDRPDNLKCLAQYNEKGFKDFGNKTHLCRILSDKKRESVDVFATDSVTDAVVEFDRKILGESLVEKQNELKKIGQNNSNNSPSFH